MNKKNDYNYAKAKSTTVKLLMIYCLICFIIVFLIIVFFKMHIHETVYYNYETAKEETLKFLNENIEELEKTSKRLLSQKEKKAIILNKELYYDKEDGKEYIRIYMDAQGPAILGKQYWSLIYCENDYLNGKDIHIYDENKETKNNTTNSNTQTIDFLRNYFLYT